MGNDRALLDRIRAGDLDAFARLYEEHGLTTALVTIESRGGVEAAARVWLDLWRSPPHSTVDLREYLTGEIHREARLMRVESKDTVTA